jgi:hypothetical protein
MESKYDHKPLPRFVTLAQFESQPELSYGLSIKNHKKLLAGSWDGWGGGSDGKVAQKY